MLSLVLVLVQGLICSAFARDVESLLLGADDSGSDPLKNPNCVDYEICGYGFAIDGTNFQKMTWTESGTGPFGPTDAQICITSQEVKRIQTIYIAMSERYPLAPTVLLTPSITTPLNPGEIRIGDSCTNT